MRAKSKSFLFVTAVVMSFSCAASAQTFIDPSRTTTAVDQTGGNNPVLKAKKPEQVTLRDELENFAPASPGDNDLGQQLILRRKEHNNPWHVSVDSSYFWTDNAANVNRAKVDDWFFAGGVNIGYQPRIGKRVFLDLNVGQHWFQYNKVSELDFQSGEASAGLIMVMPELANTVFYVNYYYQRLTRDLSEEPIFNNHSIRVGAQKTFLINRLNSFNLGAQASFALNSEPVELTRNEYSFNAGYSFKIMRGLFLNASYRISYFDYYEFEGRKDWWQSASVSLTYQPKTWLEISASYNYTFNDSNLTVFDYQTQLAGPAVALKMKF
jgi:hypothetical protein